MLSARPASDIKPKYNNTGKSSIDEKVMKKENLFRSVGNALPTYESGQRTQNKEDERWGVLEHMRDNKELRNTSWYCSGFDSERFSDFPERLINDYPTPSSIAGISHTSRNFFCQVLNCFRIIFWDVRLIRLTYFIAQYQFFRKGGKHHMWDRSKLRLDPFLFSALW